MNIQRQVAQDRSTIINAEQINNNIFDNPLKFFCDKKISENEELEPFLQVVRYIVNSDMLKKRFSGNNYRYQELVDTIENYILEGQECKHEELDDGYKSIIKCIISVATQFTLVVDNNIEQLRINLNQALIGQIDEMGLAISYSNEIQSYSRYIEAKNIAEKVMKECSIYINCALQYGNFFQFNNIYIRNISEVPFIAEEIKLRVSNSIIPNLIKPLYGDSPECGLREILQNAFDATKEFEKEISENEKNVSLDKMKIELQIVKNKAEAILKVRDYGIGMEKSILLEKYFVIGESSKRNTNLDLVGQFGIGALAAFLLGEEIEVKTKHFKENILYHFKYYLNETENINISKIQDDTFWHGTEITIKLNDKLNNLTDKELDEKLKIDEWYVLSDFPIEYTDDYGNKKDIFMLQGENYKWENLIQEENLIVNYLDENKTNKYPNRNQIIYNGLVVPEPYMLKCNYIKKKPYLDIKSYDRSIKLNLERSKVESGLERVIDSLEKKFIDIGLINLESSVDKIVNNKNQMIQFTYSDEYLHSLPLFFCQEGFGVYSQINIEKLKKTGKYKNIIKVYGYCRSFIMTLDQLNSDAIYLFMEKTLDKKDIVDIVESGCYNQVFISSTFIERFFLYATNQYNGFRKSLMEQIYRYFGQEVFEGSANDFWTRHNANKEFLFRDRIEKSDCICIGHFKYEGSVENILSLSDELVVEIKSLNWVCDGFDTKGIDKGYIMKK